ncbi:MAG: hypothetical protein AB1656_14460 [Candidatus Omnitrophota bacterium]
MKFRIQLKKLPSGGYIARSIDKPECSVQGTTREEALNAIKEEIRYRWEFCACAWVEEDFVELAVEEIRNDE